MRQRQLCGLTTLRDLRPAGPGRWSDGAFYDPQDGKTYGVSAQLASADVITARIYLGVPLLGQNRTLVRVPHGVSAGLVLSGRRRRPISCATQPSLLRRVLLSGEHFMNIASIARVAAIVAAAGAIALPALAQDGPSDAQMHISGGSVAFLAGVSWGHGRVEYRGRSYRVKARGLKVGSIGGQL